MLHQFSHTPGGSQQRRFGPPAGAGGNPNPGAQGGLGLARAGFDPAGIRAAAAAHGVRDRRPADQRTIWTPNDGWQAPSAKAFGRAGARGTVPVHIIGAGDGGVQLGGKRFAGERLELEWDPREGVLLDRHGALLLAGLTPSDVHDPTELPTYLAGFSNGNFRHEQVCQVIPVLMDEDKYRTFNSSAAFRPVQVKTDDDATPAELKVQSSLTSYKVVVRRIAAFIPDPTERQVTNQGYDLRYVYMERCKRALNMDLELDVLGSSGLLTTSGNWNANNRVTLASSYAWGDTSGNASNSGALSDPIADLNGRDIASSQEITAWHMNKRVGLCFLSHPKVRDYMRQWLGDASAADKLRQDVGSAQGRTVDFSLPLLGQFCIHTARVESNTAGSATDYIMSDVVVAVVQPPGVPTNGEQIATAYNFRRKGPAGVGFYTREVRFDARGAGGTLIIVEEASIPTMTSGICGGYIGAVLQ